MHPWLFAWTVGLYVLRAVRVVVIILIIDYMTSLQHNCACGVVSTSRKCQIRKLHAVVQPLYVRKTTFQKTPLLKRRFSYMHNIKSVRIADDENAP